eukprot:Skav203024  [mRNA]  locus=scaffold583:346069:349973:+ [translate_table: standard]
MPTAALRHPFVGARVEGPKLDLSQVSEQDIADVFAPALEKYGLLLFPGQSLEPCEFFDFLRRFPDVDQEENPFAQKDPSCLPELPVVRALGTMDSQVELHRGAVPVAGLDFDGYLACRDIQMSVGIEESNAMGLEWHSDGCGLTGLYAAQVPSGAERRSTCWVSGYRAWETWAKAVADGLGLVGGWWVC